MVTQPDRPAGRGHAPAPPPVKVAALEHGLTVLQPENVSAPESVEQLQALAPDVLVVAAYGQILRQRLLDVPTRGSLNVHASLLPRHRGASPIAAAILAGDEVTGVTVMEVVRALDAGPMVARVEEPISPFDTTGSLEQRLSLAGGELLASTLDGWAAGEIVRSAAGRRAGDLRAAAQARGCPARLVAARGRPLAPGARLQPLAGRLHAVARRRAAHPGSLAAGGRQRSASPARCSRASDCRPRRRPSEATFSVQTGSGRLAIVRLQRPGRKPLSGAEFLRGQRDFVGTKLG